jgi:hypothetical protein
MVGVKEGENFAKTKGPFFFFFGRRTRKNMQEEEERKPGEIP